MTRKAPPGRTPAAEAARQARLEREAAALRANLQRRKAQARNAERRTGPDGKQPDAALPAPDEPGNT